MLKLPQAEMLFIIIAIGITVTIAYITSYGPLD